MRRIISSKTSYLINTEFHVLCACVLGWGWSSHGRKAGVSLFVRLFVWLVGFYLRLPLSTEQRTALL